MQLGLRGKALLFLFTTGLAMGGISLAVVTSLQRDVTHELTSYAAERYVQYHKERTLGGIQGDLALAKKMADTPVLRRWVKKPGASNAVEPAFEELHSWVNQFSTHAAFVASKPASAFYFVDTKSLANIDKSTFKPTYLLNEGDKDDVWFFNTLSQQEPYNFNVDYSAKLNVTKLWINVVMKDSGGAIGVVGTGIDITQFINEFVKTRERGINGMFINDEGAIQGHADASLIALNAPVSSEQAKSTIWKLLPNEQERQALRKAMASLKQGQRDSVALTLTLDNQPRAAAVAYLPPLKWYTIATLDSSAVIGLEHWISFMGIFAIALLIGGVVIFLGGNREVILPLQRIAEATRRVAARDYTVRLPKDRDDEIGEVAAAFNQMTASLADSQHQIDANAAQTASALQRAESFEELAQVLFTQTASPLHLGQGALYRLSEDKTRLILCGSYARMRSQQKTEFPLGEGLAGQCALDSTTITISNPPADYLKVVSGLGTASPVSVMLLPIVNNDFLLGVLELALMKPLDDGGTKLLGNLVPMLWLNMTILERNYQTRKLLEETQDQASRMESQGALLEEQSIEMEAKHAELLQTEAWFRSILESTPDGLLVVDEHGVIILCNPRVEDIFDYKHGALIGQNIDMLVPERCRAEISANRAMLMLEQGVRQMGAGLALYGARKGGSEFPIEVNLSRLPELSGRGVCACASIRDVTERSQAEAKPASTKRATRGQKLNG